MSAELAVYSALKNILNDYAESEGINFIQENSATDDSYTPNANENYLAEFDIPTDSQSPTLNGGYEVDRGFYQINVSTPMGLGSYKNKTLAAAIKALYPRETLIKDDGYTIKIRRVTVSRGRVVRSHFRAAVSVYWQVIG